MRRLPVALRVAEQRLGLPPAIARFVLTIGATGNQNGTALYEGVVVLFLAQVFGVDLSWGQQITVVLLSVLAGVGTAGVPGGSIPMIVLVLQSIGVPGESIAIILGIDRICDMCRTVLNVTGDLALATCVSQAVVPHASRRIAASPMLHVLFDLVGLRYSRSKILHRLRVVDDLLGRRDRYAVSRRPAGS